MIYQERKFLRKNPTIYNARKEGVISLLLKEVSMSCFIHSFLFDQELVFKIHFLFP